MEGLRVFPPLPRVPRSFDLYGDGTVVLVPLPGHTPGSLSTFVNLPGLRIFHVGRGQAHLPDVAPRSPRPRPPAAR